MFKCPQNGILGSAESSKNLSGEEFFPSTTSNNITICVLWKRIVDLKQVPGLKKTKMVIYSITTTLNSTFGRIGKATADKMTGKVVSKLRLSLQREEWISCCHAKYVYETELPMPFLSFFYLYLGIKGFKLNSILYA